MSPRRLEDEKPKSMDMIDEQLGEHATFLVIIDRSIYIPDRNQPFVHPYTLVGRCASHRGHLQANRRA